MKKSIMILLLAMVFQACLREGDSGCPADMSLTFTHQDEYEGGDYDTRISNDVLLYIYKDKRLMTSRLIPYSQIEGGKKYLIRKDKEIEGELDLVAWAVPVDGGDPNILPSWSQDEDITSHAIGLTPLTRALTDCRPMDGDLYLGTVTTSEKVDVATSHDVSMINTACKLIVNVKDELGILDKPSLQPKVKVLGTMMQVNLSYEGVGNEAVVHADLASQGGYELSTNWFGIMPSGNDTQTVDVEVYQGDEHICTVKTDSRARSGGRIVVDLNLGGNVTVTVNGWRINSATVEYI